MRAQRWMVAYGYATATLVSGAAGAGAGDTSSHHSHCSSYCDTTSNNQNGRLAINRGGWGHHQGGGASTSTFTRHVAFVLSSSTGVWSPASSLSRYSRESKRSSFLALSNSDQNNENSASSLNNNNNKNSNALKTTSPSKRKRRNISSEIDYFTKQQISTIFGSGGSSEWNAFVPLSLAGRWSQQQRSTDTETNQQQRSGAAVETVFLSSPEQCQIIADAYEQYLKSNNDDTNNNESSIQNKPTTTLPLPISSSTSAAAIKLLSQTYANTPLSKSVLLALNSLFLNRDNGLFDNLPWSTWSIDPNLQERDAANNGVDGKFTMGKRVAYQRFMGKDWQGRSLSLGNLANRIRYLLEREQKLNDDNDGNDTDEQTGSSNASMSDEMEDDVMMSLSQRLLQLEIKEARMAIAECEQRLAISKTQSTAAAAAAAAADNTENFDEKEAVIPLDEARGRLQAAESSLRELNTAMQSEASDEGASFLSSFVFPWDYDKKSDDNSAKLQSKKTQSLLTSILDKLTEQETPPPYRGAIGYPAKLDTKKEVFEDSILPYTSPYELLIDIIEEQLNSEVMCCVLEPTSLLEGNLVLGGALLLKRKGVTKSTTLSGEEIFYTDDDDALGNEGVLPRSMYVVECFSDEAVGMALASEMPIFVEEGICERAGSVPVKLDVRRAAVVKRENDGGGGGENSVKDIMESLSYANRVPSIRPLDESYFSSSRLEGERIASENESKLVRIPLTTNPQLFDGSDQTPQSSSSSSTERRPVFSTFNPVKTLDEYDELTDDDKARLLLKMESFTGILPRPRVVRASTTNANGDYESGNPPSLLDDIILPLVDESVRRQYRIRDAERREDYKEAEALREEASPRQSVLESAQKAREEGLDDEADRLEEEARLYQALRADVTQDEGAYSRFLDRDEWYERETQARIKRLDKSKFGTLLDGVDLP